MSCYRHTLTRSAASWGCTSYSHASGTAAQKYLQGVCLFFVVCLFVFIPYIFFCLFVFIPIFFSKSLPTVSGVTGRLTVQWWSYPVRVHCILIQFNIWRKLSAFFFWIKAKIFLLSPMTVILNKGVYKCGEGFFLDFYTWIAHCFIFYFQFLFPNSFWVNTSENDFFLWI